LVGRYGFEKTELAYSRLGEALAEHDVRQDVLSRLEGLGR
jgi:hypothetical protein